MTPQTILTSAIPLWFWTAAAKHNDPMFLFVVPAELHEELLKLHKSAGSPGAIMLKEPGQKLRGVKVNGRRPNFGVLIYPSDLDMTDVAPYREIAENTFVPAMRLGTSVWTQSSWTPMLKDYEVLLACPDE